MKAYEVGTKNRFLDNRLQVNATAFLYDYRDFQVSALGTGSQFYLCGPRGFMQALDSGEGSALWRWTAVPTDWKRYAVLLLKLKANFPREGGCLWRLEWDRAKP